MNLRWMAIALVFLALTFVFGFKASYVNGIQPGYFEKQEAPAYGVGGMEKMGAGMGEDVQKYFEELYKDIEE